MATELEKNVDRLRESIYSLNFDISKSYLPDNEIMKNIIRQKSPSLSKEDINMIVDGQINGLTSSVSSTINVLTSSVSSTINGLTSSVSSTINGLTSSYLAKKEEISKFAKKNHIYPVAQKSIYKDEVKKIKDETRKSVMLIYKSQKDLIQDLAKISVQIANSIAGASLLVIFPTLNVPAAISLVMLIIDSIALIIDKIMNVVLHLEPLKYLALLLPADKFATITSPINVSVLVLISLLAPIKSLRNKSDSLIGKLKGLASVDNLKSQVNSLKDQLQIDKDKLAFLKLPKFPLKNTFNGTLDQINQKQKDVNDLKNRIKDLEKGYDIPDMNNGKIPEEFGKNFLNTLTPIIEEINITNNQLNEYVYDVYLQDGETLTNITEEKLEEIKGKYNIIFDN